MATIVVGELPRSIDPAVSEWGNPPTVIGWDLSPLGDGG